MGRRWTTTIGKFIDLDSGKPWNESKEQQWQDIVYAANTATMNRLTPKPLHSFITELVIENATEAKPITKKPAEMKTDNKRKYGETITDEPTPGVKEEPTEVRLVRLVKKQKESNAQVSIQNEAKESLTEKSQKKQKESTAQGAIQKESKETPTEESQKKQKESKAQDSIQNEAKDRSTEEKQKKQKELQAQVSIRKEAKE